jgi:hypothetical protein
MNEPQTAAPALPLALIPSVAPPFVVVAIPGFSVHGLYLMRKEGSV